MDISKKPWPLSTVSGIRDRIDTNPDYQRPPVWTLSQKQLLIDTILRNYDVPKLYWRRSGRKPDTYEVVDGQQRLRATWAFFDDQFKLPRNADPIDDLKVAGLKYSQLHDELRIRFDTYPLDVVLVEEAEEDEVREMFLRLQNGTSLRAQEKRNAYPGPVRDLVRQLSAHEFFQVVNFQNARYLHDLIAAQLLCLERAGEPTNVKNRDLNRMYECNEGEADFQIQAKRVVRILNVLQSAFPEKSPELTRYNVIALYCVASELQVSYVSTEFRPILGPWFVDFEARRRKQEALSEDEADPEWVSYKEKISHSTDAEDSIRSRMNFLLRDLLVAHPTLSLKDPKREFTHQQRLAVFRRDGGICQIGLKCERGKVRWDDWHCDHRLAWSEGGRTIVENGQVACAACNLAKGNRSAGVS